jgi:hypothetical protein
MTKIIKAENVEALAVGAGILGSGGGGNPYYELEIAKYELSKVGEINVLSVDDLADDDLVLPIAFMGAPLVSQEKLSNGREFLSIFEEFKKYYGKYPKAIFSAEIGGANAISPIIASCRSGIPLLDGDLLGRAYPELQMSAANLFGVSCAPSFLADCLDNTMVVNARNANKLEEIARQITVACGSSLAIGVYVLTGKEAKQVVIKGTVSKAIILGDLALAQGDYLSKLCQATSGKIIGRGIICDIKQNINNGFLEGEAIIDSEDGQIKITYQNEYLAVYQQQKLSACTPDIITIFDEESATPILSDTLIYGLRVAIVSFPADKIWYTPAGLKLVGREAFKIK